MTESVNPAPTEADAYPDDMIRTREGWPLIGEHEPIRRFGVILHPRFPRLYRWQVRVGRWLHIPVRPPKDDRSAMQQLVDAHPEGVSVWGSSFTWWDDETGLPISGGGVVTSDGVVLAGEAHPDTHETPAP